ncbi:TonB-dependent receptor [Fulvivirgaceae bacterium BMA10]|uniref:TonB-dependent receptor n=1 Tax=Splendidivirga corallicola TaxID=3051826 RepID=A0ABT8KU34_9BACT|nr:TonB-dependent receptor [Fulvivirgaceae bacterium BMA10]
MSRILIYATFVQCLLCGMLLARGSNAQSINEIFLSVNWQNANMKQVLNSLEKQTDFRFLYSKKKMDQINSITLKADNKSLGDILKILANQKNLYFKRVNQTISVKRVLEKIPEGPLVMEEQQDKTISGNVTDENGNGLPGVSVLIKDTTIGTVTDLDGKYQINVPDDNAILKFSYVGYIPQEIIVGANSVINVRLEPDLAYLQEIVVTGYTSQSKRSITGAVETIESSELTKNPATSVEQQLQGKISGVNIVTSGAPGGGSQVRIRGLSNFGQRDPLYIIDGAPSGAGLNEINPDDIESISVLKDGSAASIYGARAANGVVLITTKRGKKGQPTKVSYSNFFAIDRDPGKIEVLNAEQWGQMEWQGQRASVRGTGGEASFVPSHPTYGNGANPVIPEFLNGDPSLPYDPVTNRLLRSADTDWYDAVTQNGFSQNHNLNVTGGSENSRYGISFGYLNREGTQIETSFQRYSTRVNTEFLFLDDRLRIGENVGVAYSERNGSNGVSIHKQIFHPLIPRRDEGGNFGGTLNGILGLGTNFINPEAGQIRLNNAIARRWRIFGNAYIEADVTSDLTFKSSIAIDYVQNNNTTFRPENVEGGNPGNSLNEFSGFGTSLTWTNTLNYLKSFGDHSITVLVGTEAIELFSKNVNFSGTGFFTEDLDFVSINTSSTTNSLTGSSSERNLSSLFGKLDYSFKDKYLINFTLRRDGSSALGPNNRFDLFPAVGVGWVLSDETFLAENSVIDFLKLRAGWAAVGNQNSLGNFDFVSSFSQDPNFNSTGYDITAGNGSTPTNGIALLGRGNPDLVWESSETLNIGLDFALLNDKISGSVEWYDKRTKDLLQRVPVPLAAGIARAPFVNLGEIQNKGVDVSLTYSGRVNSVDFEVTGIVSTYKNEVLDIDGNPEAFFQGPGGNPNIIAARTAVGHEIGAFYGRIVDGVIQDGTNAGNFNFRDLDDNGVIDFNDQDFIGSPHPDFTYSLNMRAQYKGFDFTAFFRGSQGNDIWQWTKIFTDFQFREGINRSTRVLNAWRPDNPSNTLAEYNLNTANDNLQASSYYVEDGSYLRLQTLQVGYTIPKVAKFEKFRVYLQGQNVFTSTNYSGIDPEIGENGGLELGVDRGNVYVVPRTILFGLNITL